MAADNPVVVSPDPTSELPPGGLSDEVVESVVASHATRLRQEGLLMLPLHGTAARM